MKTNVSAPSFLSNDRISITINLKWITDKRMISTLKYNVSTIILWRKNSILFIFVLNLMMLSNNIYEKVVAQECQIERVPPENKLLADCTELKINKVPSELDPKIQILDLSRNLIIKLDKESFSKYTELIEIRMTDLFHDTTPAAAADAFQPLQKLEILLMDNTLYEGVNFHFPLSLKRLSFNGNRRKEFDASSLIALQNLSLSNNLLDFLPLIHPSAPLTHLYLSQNPLNGLTAESLANLCSLQYVDLELDETSDINTVKDNYCKCLRLEKWIEQRNISGTKSLKCLAPSNPNCDLKFVEASANHRKCLINHEKKIVGGRSFKQLFLIGFALGAILICILGFVIYKHNSSTESESPPESAPSTSSESQTNEKFYPVEGDEHDEITSEEREEDEE